ncbi:MAG: gfo/Idh/MocA family oxidoreductase [Calditrichaeota bacterium]|nr:MAG: gfo/Idh/MocA family oxidoreductase [Calditrichota bacterium]
MVKVGVIGAGKWGKNHIRTLSNLDCELVGLADIDPQAEKLAKDNNILYFQDFYDMLPYVDAVTVAVPTDKHYDVVKECLIAKKHVLVEKPVTLRAQKTQELVELAEQQKCVFSVGYLYRFNPAVIKLKEILEEAGQLQYITTRYVHSTNPPRRDSGAVVNLGVHLIDILNFILEKHPGRVYCKAMDLFGNGLEESAMIMLDYDKFYASLEVSSCHPEKARDIWIIAEKLKVYCDFQEQTIEVHPIEVSYEGVKKIEPYSVEVEKSQPLSDELAHFLTIVSHELNGEYTKMVNIGKEEYFTSRVCELALLSAEIKRDLDVMPDPMAAANGVKTNGSLSTNGTQQKNGHAYSNGKTQKNGVSAYA